MTMVGKGYGSDHTHDEPAAPVLHVVPAITLTLTRAEGLAVLGLIYCALKLQPLACNRELIDVAAALEPICYPAPLTDRA